MCAIMALLMNLFFKYSEKDNSFFGKYTGAFNVWRWLFFAISCVWIVIGSAENIGYYSCQKIRFEEARMHIQNIDIYNRRYEFLITDFKIYLGKDYPDIEKEIFSKMTADDKKNLQNVLTVYPELKSSFTITSLVNNMKEIADASYQEMIAMERLAKDIRYKRTSPWHLVHPSIPGDIYEYVY